MSSVSSETTTLLVGFCAKLSNILLARANTSCKPSFIVLAFLQEFWQAWLGLEFMAGTGRPGANGSQCESGQTSAVPAHALQPTRRG